MERRERRGNDDKVVSFAKIFNPFDTNYGGGFSVPRFCVDSIFPLLSYQVEPPIQTLFVTGNVVWEFRHIYRGTPRRHLLPTSWSTFVNHKMLVTGDFVVFMRNTKGEMFVGVRLSVRATVSSDGVARVELSHWRRIDDVNEKEGQHVISESRNCSMVLV